MEVYLYGKDWLCDGGTLCAVQYINSLRSIWCAGRILRNTVLNRKLKFSKKKEKRLVAMKKGLGI